MLVSFLLDLEARQSLPTIRKAYAAEKVDLGICGGYDDILLLLGENVNIFFLVIIFW